MNDLNVGGVGLDAAGTVQPPPSPLDHDLARAWALAREGEFEPFLDVCRSLGEDGFDLLVFSRGVETHRMLISDSIKLCSAAADLDPSAAMAMKIACMHLGNLLDASRQKYSRDDDAFERLEAIRNSIFRPAVLAASVCEPPSKSAIRNILTAFPSLALSAWEGSDRAMTYHGTKTLLRLVAQQNRPKGCSEVAACMMNHASRFEFNVSLENVLLEVVSEQIIDGRIDCAIEIWRHVPSNQRTLNVLYRHMSQQGTQDPAHDGHGERFIEGISKENLLNPSTRNPGPQSEIPLQRAAVAYQDLLIRGLSRSARTLRTHMNIDLGAECLVSAVRSPTGSGSLKEALSAVPKNRIDDKDERGMTALHWAASTGNFRAFVELVEAGASLRVTDRRGRSPKVVASKDIKAQVIAYLQSLSARKSVESIIDSISRSDAAHIEQDTDASNSDEPGDRSARKTPRRGSSPR
jgi:ankyrin repeat protein